MSKDRNIKSNKKRTQAERTALSDERMFEVAIKLILERGTQKATLKEIGELAGYSRGLANYRFGSKDGLFKEVIHLCSALWAQQLQRYVQNKKGVHAFVAAIDAYEDFLLSSPDRLRAMYILWFESVGRDSYLREKLAVIHEESRRDVRRWIDEGISTGDISSLVHAQHFAEQYCSFVFGLVYQWLVNPDAFDIKELLADYKKNMLAVLSPTTSALSD